MNLEQLPIQSQEAEMCLVGSLLLDPKSFFKVIDLINADDFYSSKHHCIFKTFQ